MATPKFDPKNPEHVKIMDEINYGNGLPVGGWGEVAQDAELISGKGAWTEKVLGGRRCWACLLSKEKRN